MSCSCVLAIPLITSLPRRSLTVSAPMGGPGLLQRLIEGEIHPYAAQLLKSLNHDVSSARSKDWNEFTAPSAPGWISPFTLCDDAANEPCVGPASR